MLALGWPQHRFEVATDQKQLDEQLVKLEVRAAERKWARTEEKRRQVFFLHVLYHCFTSRNQR
jgi:hypothetical protein